MSFYVNLKNKYLYSSAEKKDSILFSISNYFQAVLQFLQGFILAKILGPTLMGEVAAVSLITTYGSYLTFGTHQARMQKVPMFRGKGDNEMAEMVKNTCFSFTLLVSVSVCICLSIYAIFSDLSTFYKFGFIALSISLPLYFIFNFQVGGFLIDRNYKKVTFAQSLKSIIVFVISLSTVFFVSNKAVLIGVLSSNLIAGFITSAISSEKFKLKIDWKVLIFSIKFGAPIMAQSMFYTLLSTIDKIMIIKYLNTTQLGLYSLAISMAAFYFLAGQSVVIVLYHKALSEYAKSDSDKEVFNKFYRGAIALALVSPLVGFAIEGVIYFIIDNFLPKYIFSKDILAIIIPPSVFMTIAPFFLRALLVTEKVLYIAKIQILTIIFAIVANYLALQVFSGGIEAVIVATGISYFFYFSLFAVISGIKVGKKTFRFSIGFIFKLILLFCLVLLIQKGGFVLKNLEMDFSLNYGGGIYLIFTISLYSAILYFSIFKLKLIKGVSFKGLRS